MARFSRFASIFALCIVLVNCPSTPKPPASMVSAPSFSPVEGVYPDAQSVSISTPRRGRRSDTRLTGPFRLLPAGRSTPSPSRCQPRQQSGQLQQRRAGQIPPW